MSTSFVVTVVTEIDFVGSATDDMVASHLARIVEHVRHAADSVSTRVTAAVRVTYCDGGVVGWPIAGQPVPEETSAPE
jgi:hypothetical protein